MSAPLFDAKQWRPGEPLGATPGWYIQRRIEGERAPEYVPVVAWLPMHPRLFDMGDAILIPMVVIDGCTVAVADPAKGFRALTWNRQWLRSQWPEPPRRKRPEIS